MYITQGSRITLSVYIAHGSDITVSVFITHESASMLWQVWDAQDQTYAVMNVNKQKHSSGFASRFLVCYAQNSYTFLPLHVQS